MNATKTLLLPALVLLPLTLGSNAPATRIRFTPGDGKSLTKTFESKTQLSLDDMSIDGPAGAVPPKMEMTMTIHQKVSVTDEYTKMGDGRPKQLARTFDSIGSEVATAMKMEMMGQSRSQDQNSNAKSELEGKKVVFKWDAEKKEFTKTLDPAEDKPDLLKGLTEDMDLRALLPESEVKEGDEWDVDVKSIAGILVPGGDLSMKPEKEDEKTLGMGADGLGSLSSMIGDDVEGTAKAKLTSLRDVDGAHMAVVHVTIKISAKADMTDKARKAMEKADLPPEVGKLELDHLDVEYKLEAEGDLTWDLGAGHFHAFDMSGTTAMKSAQGLSIEVAGKNIAMEQKQEFSGTSTFNAQAK